MDKLKALLLWLGLILSETTSQLCLKAGVGESIKTHGISLGIVLGYGFLVLSFLLWMQILKNTRLSLALSATSLVYVTVAMAAHFILGEPLPLLLIIGCVFIGAGVFALGAEDV